MSDQGNTRNYGLYSRKVFIWPVTLMMACVFEIAVTIPCSPHQTEKVGDPSTCFGFPLVGPHRQEGTVSVRRLGPSKFWTCRGASLTVWNVYGCEPWRESVVVFYMEDDGLVSPEFHTCSDSRSFRVGITFCRLACFVGRSAIVWFVRSCCCWWVGCFALLLCCFSVAVCCLLKDNSQGVVLLTSKLNVFLRAYPWDQIWRACFKTIQNHDSLPGTSLNFHLRHSVLQVLHRCCVWLR